MSAMRTLSSGNSATPRTRWTSVTGILLVTLLTSLARPVFGAQFVTCPAPVVKARLPPSLDPAANSSSPANWTAPPSGWFYGTWHITYSSNRGYGQLENLQFQSAPAVPTCSHPSPAGCPPGSFPGQNIDLQVWSKPGDPSGKLLSAFGFDTPRRSAYPQLGPGWDTTYDFRGTGPLKNTTNTWEMLAWGYDDNGDGYFVAYETAVSTGSAPAGLDIESRSTTGPTANTLQKIRTALQNLGNSDLNALVTAVELMPRNANEPTTPFVCGPTCRNNTDLVPGTAPSSPSSTPTPPP